jgi:hypothetical protein
MGKEVEVLENHANLGADLLDILYVVGKLDAIYDDLATLMFFQAIDAANQS